MDKLRSMGYALGSLTMDPSKGGLAMQEVSTQHSLQQLAYDPSFAERAAKYSTFGSANYGSSSQGGYSSFDTGKLRDVLENESIAKATSFSGSEEETKPASPGAEAIEGAKSDGVATSQENSSGSQPGGPQRKRKGSAASSAAKEPTTSTGGEINSTEKPTSLKRQRSGSSLDLKTKAERSASENSGDSSPRSLKGATSKPPPKDDLPKQDYIHVRARRGQATDSHSLAERVRREKISERMKFLQDLVPGCSKVTGKAVMLDEIINYVQSLQRQIEFLSMKLAAVNPRMEYSYDVLGKDMLHSRSPETTLLGPDPLPGYGDLHCHGPVHPMHMPPTASHLDLHRDLRTVDSGLCDPYLRRSMSVPSMASLVSADDHFDPLCQGASLCNGDLQSVVEMGFIQGRQGLGLGTHLGHGASLCMAGKLKVEM